MISPLPILCCSTTNAKWRVPDLVQCSGCGDRYRHARHGTYERFLPDSNETIEVQRYRCQNPDCPCVTFSILPFPCLRYKRQTLATLTRIARQAASHSVQVLAQVYGKGWTAMRRLIRAARQVSAFFCFERSVQSWGPCPCADPRRHWTGFTQALSYVKVPEPEVDNKNTQTAGWIAGQGWVSLHTSSTMEVTWAEKILKSKRKT